MWRLDSMHLFAGWMWYSGLQKCVKHVLSFSSVFSYKYMITAWVFQKMTLTTSKRLKWVTYRNVHVIKNQSYSQIITYVSMWFDFYHFLLVLIQAVISWKNIQDLQNLVAVNIIRVLFHVSKLNVMVCSMPKKKLSTEWLIIKMISVMLDMLVFIQYVPQNKTKKPHKDYSAQSSVSLLN